MEEVTPVTEPVGSSKRTKANINAEYFNVCAELGQLHYHLKGLRDTLDKREYDVAKLEYKIEALVKENDKLELKEKTVNIIKENAKDVSPESTTAELAGEVSKSSGEGVQEIPV